MRVEEGWRGLNQARRPHAHGCLRVIAACGLRLRAGGQFLVAQIASARMQLPIRGGTGNKDRTRWCTPHNPIGLVPRLGALGDQRRTAPAPMDGARRFHPHVHSLAPALGVASDATVCRPRKPAFRVPVTPLAIRFRAKRRAAVRQTDWSAPVAPEPWQQAWGITGRGAGSRAAALPYLAPSIFRGARSTNRIGRGPADRGPFRSRAGQTTHLPTVRRPARLFRGRLLPHVVPQGVGKGRYDGLCRRWQRTVRAQLRHRLLVTMRRILPPAPTAPSPRCQCRRWRSAARSVASRCRQAGGRPLAGVARQLE